MKEYLKLFKWIINSTIYPIQIVNFPYRKSTITFTFTFVSNLIHRRINEQLYNKVQHTIILYSIIKTIL